MVTTTNGAYAKTVRRSKHNSSSGQRSDIRVLFLRVPNLGSTVNSPQPNHKW